MRVQSGQRLQKDKPVSGLIDLYRTIWFNLHSARNIWYVPQHICNTHKTWSFVSLKKMVKLKTFASWNWKSTESILRNFSFSRSTWPHNKTSCYVNLEQNVGMFKNEFKFLAVMVEDYLRKRFWHAEGLVQDTFESTSFTSTRSKNKYKTFTLRCGNCLADLQILQSFISFIFDW